MTQVRPLPSKLQAEISFSTNVKVLRLDRNLSQAALADMVGCTESLISTWETGRYYPTLNNLIRIAKALKCSLDELVYKDLA